MSHREHKLADLKQSAIPLTKYCSKVVVDQIEAKVQETVTAWINTASTLTELCEKYQRAVTLWSSYKTVTEELTQLLEEHITCLEAMDPNDTLQYVKVKIVVQLKIYVLIARFQKFGNKIPTYKQRLDEIQQIVDAIAADLELDSTHLLKVEVNAIAKKLEYIQVAINKLESFADERTERLMDLEKEIQTTTSSLHELQKVTRSNYLNRCSF